MPLDSTPELVAFHEKRPVETRYGRESCSSEDRQFERKATSCCRSAAQQRLSYPRGLDRGGNGKATRDARQEPARAPRSADQLADLSPRPPRERGVRPEVG